MMSSWITKEVIIFGHALVWGLGFMACYDVLRIFRHIIRHSFIWIGIEDILYWISVSLASFIFLLIEINGAIRWYAITGLILGLLFWNYTVSLLINRIIRFIAKILGKLLQKKHKSITM